MSDMPQGEKTVDDREIVEYMHSHSDPAYTTAELADKFDISTEGMRRRLEELKEADRVLKKKPSSRTVIWWCDQDHGAESFSA